MSDIAMSGWLCGMLSLAIGVVGGGKTGEMTLLFYLISFGCYHC